MSHPETSEAAAVRRRQEAERRVRDGTRRGPLSAEDAARLVHELEVHQIELELQNTELREAQLALDASRARYFDLYDLAPVGYLSLDAQGIITEANLTAATLLGVPRASLAHHALTRFVARTDQDVYYRHRRMLEHSGAAQACELRITRKDGHTFWARLEGSADGRGSRVVLSDISAKRKTEETLAASELRHRTLFESSYDALLTLSVPACTITGANARAARLLGDDALPTQPLWHFAPPAQPSGRASLEELEARARSAVEAGSHEFEWSLRPTSGEVLTVSVTLTRMELDGAVTLQATIRDLTEVRALQAQVAQADRLASMGMLAAGVGHEINNPLTYMLYNLESVVDDLERLDDQPLASAQRTSLLTRARDALDGTRHIRSITRALGAFSRIDATRGAPVDLNHAVESAITMAHNEIRHRATLSRELTEVPPVSGSEAQISQVLLNLLLHAAHSIAEGEADQNTIAVRTWHAGQDVYVEVRDTGHGIAEAHLARVFEPFLTRTRDRPGLGLAIAARIVRDLGGDIQVESQDGAGSRFVARLPQAIEHPSNPPVLDPALAVTVLRGRILMVDDEPRVRQVTEKVLGALHEVVVASSGPAALQLLETDAAFDVILCDLMMPQMTGATFHERLAERDPTLAARVVLMSGGAFAPRASKYILDHALVVLDKPVEAETLRRVVGERVGRRRT